jgi:hypothetical protein
LPSHLSRAGEWFLNSGIQEPGGGVARYYRADEARNCPVSTEITGYSASAFVYLHALTKDPRFLERAVCAARFLARDAWNDATGCVPFELSPGAPAYFFDSGIIVRGLLAVWRASGEDECLRVALALGKSMARHFPAPDHSCHPILSLPDRRPAERDGLSWSRSPGCYQLKAAMAWWDLWEATGESEFRPLYERCLELALKTYGQFLPGHPDRLKVMDRLHAFLYFLEGLLPRATETLCAAALCDGIGRVAHYRDDLHSEFDRADVLAQLLRIRLYADSAGAVPLDREAAAREARALAAFQAAGPDPHLSGGYYFARYGARWSAHVSPVPTAFAVQALSLWESIQAGGPRPLRHLLI